MCQWFGAGAGDVLTNVNYALTELNKEDMPKKNEGTFEEISFKYLDWWDSRGFDIRFNICVPNGSCAGAQAYNSTGAAAKAGKAMTNVNLSNINLFMTSDHQDSSRVGWKPPRPAVEDTE